MISGAIFSLNDPFIYRLCMTENNGKEDKIEPNIMSSFA